MGKLNFNCVGNCAGLLRFLQVLGIICIDDSYAKFISPVVQIYLAVSDCVLRDTN